MKPIETVYNGYKFRSRLEARWAVFFNTLGLKYQYEPEGFDLENGVWYLPDFWLPDIDCWIEVKGEEPTQVELRKAYLLAHQLPTVKKPLTLENIEQGISAHDYSKETAPFHLVGKEYEIRPNVMIAVGEPWAEFDQSNFGETVSYFVSEVAFEEGRHFFSNRQVFIQCRCCERIGFESRNVHFPKYDSAEASSYGFCHSENPSWADSPRLIAAYTAARQSRFEHGAA